MLAIAHDALLDQRTDPKKADSPTHRFVWESARDRARKLGREDTNALIALASPPYDRCWQYLRDWSDRLLGRSGAGPDGMAALSDVTIVAWSQNSGYAPSPNEVDFLMLADTVRRHPESLTDAMHKEITEGRTAAVRAQYPHLVRPDRPRARGKALWPSKKPALPAGAKDRRAP